MSFAAEMRDFFSGFKATSSVAGDIRDRIDARKNTFDFDAAKKSAPGMFGPGVSQSGSKTSGQGSSVPPPQIKKILDDNVPEDMRGYAYRMAQKESSFNPKAVSKTGATGLFQFTSGTWTDMTKQSIGAHTDGRLDPTANTQAFVKLTERNRDYLTKVLGRTPTDGELAIAHQQGPAGAAYLITGRAPKGMDVAQVEKNLAHNNIKAKGIDAAKHIASYYGFDLGDMSKVAQGAIPDVPVASYTPPQVPSGDNAVADTGSSSTASDASDDSSDPYQSDDLLSGSRNAAIDIAAIDIPEGAKLYSPGDLSQTASTMYSAEGGSVPWAGETSHISYDDTVNMGTWRPQQSYGPLQAVPAVADDPTKPKGGNKNKNRDVIQQTHGGLWTNAIGGGFGAPPYYTKNTEFHGGGYSDDMPSRRAFGAVGFQWPKMREQKKKLAAGGIVGDEPAEEAGVHSEEMASPAPAIPAAPVTPAGNPPQGRANRDVLAMDQRPRPNASGEGGVSIGRAIDLGLKHLTSKLGLDRSSAAVGPDPELRNNQRKLVNGAIAPNEGPPNSQEVQQIFQTVDPNGELDDSLRTIYAMKKGVEFYLQRGDTDKAGKFAAGLIQYSNLLSRRYGYEAVQAGKSGDVNGMVKYAIKAYDAVPDGLSADVQATDGGYQVTRTNEDGDVVDQHMLTPQQIFQMATGISTGSGYFEALMDVAQPGTSAAARKEKQAKARAGNLDKLLPDIKGDMDPGEIDAWSSAVEDGDYDTLNKILGNVQQRRRDRQADERYDKRQADIDRRIEEGRAATEANLDKRIAASDASLDKRLTASEERQQKAIDAADERGRKRDEARDAADEKKRERKVKGKVKLYNDYAPDMTASEKEQWQSAVEENDPEALDDIMSNVDKRRDNKRSDDKTTAQNKAVDDRQERGRKAQEDKDLAKRQREAGTLNEMYDAYAPQMTTGQKKAWKKAFQDNDPDTIKVIINSIDRSFGAPLADETNSAEPDMGGDTSGGAIPTKPAPSAPSASLSTSAEAAPVTSGSKPFPSDQKSKVDAAIKAANGDKAKIDAIRSRARDWATKNGFSTEGL